jgi:hypothetical protein
MVDGTKKSKTLPSKIAKDIEEFVRVFRGNNPVRPGYPLKIANRDLREALRDRFKKSINRCGEWVGIIDSANTTTPITNGDTTCTTVQATSLVIVPKGVEPAPKVTPSIGMLLDYELGKLLSRVGPLEADLSSHKKRVDGLESQIINLKSLIETLGNNTELLEDLRKQGIPTEYNGTIWDTKSEAKLAKLMIDIGQKCERNEITFTTKYGPHKPDMLINGEYYLESKGGLGKPIKGEEKPNGIRKLAIAKAVGLCLKTRKKVIVVGDDIGLWAHMSSKHEQGIGFSVEPVGDTDFIIRDNPVPSYCPECYEFGFNENGRANCVINHKGPYVRGPDIQLTIRKCIEFFNDSPKIVSGFTR